MKRLACTALLWTAACGPGIAVEPAELDPAEVAAGRELYLQHGCASCHGRGGAGDGPAAAGAAGRPRDLRDVSSFAAGADVESIAATVAQGRVTPATSMPGFGHLGVRERELIAKFVVSLRAGPTPTAEAVDVEEPIVRPMPIPGRNTGMYLRITNGRAVDAALVGATTEAAELVELHATTHVDGLMRMEPIERAVVPARGALELRPGGMHLMFVRITRPLTAGGRVAVDLEFEDGTILRVEATVAEPPEGATEGDHEHHR